MKKAFPKKPGAMLWGKEEAVDSLMQQKRLILNENSPFTIREAYNILRTNIKFAVPGDGCKVVGISSASMSEGKSINCLNLSISFAESNARVLLLDCDLRRPNIARLLDLDVSPGLSNLLAGECPIDRTIRKTRFDTLDVIPAGDIPPNPSELLGMDKMESIIKELSGRYDYIFVDTPPINVVADTSVIAKHLMGVVVVVRLGSTDHHNLTDAVNQLNFAHVKVLGFLLNNATLNTGSKRYKKYGYYHYSHEKRPRGGRK